MSGIRAPLLSSNGVQAAQFLDNPHSLFESPAHLGWLTVMMAEPGEPLAQ
jgi:hypothetical protein